jgi:hypothetical protein
MQIPRLDFRSQANENASLGMISFVLQMLVSKTKQSAATHRTQFWVGIQSTEKPMYKGTLIDDLIATVERAETSFRLEPEQESKLAYWYAVAQSELANLNRTYDLAGVA